MTKDAKAYVSSLKKTSIFCLTNALETLVEIPINNIDNLLDIRSLGCNRDGNIIVVAVSLRGDNGYRLAISRDYGKTWSTLSGFQSEASIGEIKVSSSGKYIMVSTVNPHCIYVSTNAGSSFQKVVTQNYAIVTLAMSGNESYMFYSFRNSLFRSTDYGKTWNSIGSIPGSTNLTSFDMSYDGKYMVCTREAMSNVFVSTDSGNIWKSITMDPRDITKAVISGKGKYSVAVGVNNVFQSSDFLESYLFRQKLGERGQVYFVTNSK